MLYELALGYRPFGVHEGRSRWSTATAKEDRTLDDNNRLLGFGIRACTQ